MVCCGLRRLRPHLLTVNIDHALDLFRLICRDSRRKCLHIGRTAGGGLKQNAEHRAERASIRRGPADRHAKRLVRDGNETVKLAVGRTIGTFPHRERLKHAAGAIQQLKADARGRLDAGEIRFDEVFAAHHRWRRERCVHRAFVPKYKGQETQTGKFQWIRSLHNGNSLTAVALRNCRAACQWQSQREELQNQTSPPHALEYNKGTSKTKSHAAWPGSVWPRNHY